MKIGNTIRVLRKQKQITQVAMANKIGMSSNALGEIETNIREARLMTLENIARVLDTTVEVLWLMSLEKPKIMDMAKANVWKQCQSTMIRLYEEAADELDTRKSDSDVSGKAR